MASRYYAFDPEKMRAARVKANLSQRQLAKLCDCEQEQVSRWEAGSIAPASRTLQKLARELRVTVDELMSGRLGQPPETAPPTEAQVRTKGVPWHVWFFDVLHKGRFG